jgi:hypothetical protein
VLTRDIARNIAARGRAHNSIGMQWGGFDSCRVIFNIADIADMAKKLQVQIKPRVTTVGSHRGGKIQIDKRLPKKDRKGIIEHEAKEAKLMKAGDKYITAHRDANKAEKKLVGTKQFNKEEHDSMSLYRKNLASKKGKTKAKGKCIACGKINCRSH